MNHRACGFRPSGLRLATMLGLSLLAFLVPAAEFDLATNIAQVYEAGPGAKAAGRPVRLTAQVLYADLSWSSVFLQDEAQGMHLAPTGIDREPKPGDLVELTGVTAVEDNAVRVVQPALRLLGHRSLPEPIPAQEPNLFSERLSARWIEVTGTIRQADLQDARLRFDLLSGSTRLPGIVRHPPPADYDLTSLIGARVRVRAVCANRYEGSRVVGATLMVPKFDQLQVLARVPRPAAEEPVSLIRDLVSFKPAGESTRRVRLRGEVVSRRGAYSQTGASFLLRDATGSAIVRTFSKNPILVGTRLDVWAFPAVENAEMILEDAVFMASTAASTPAHSLAAPPSVTETSALQTVRAVRALSKDQAALRLPVRLAGVITYADRAWESFFLQDETGSVYVRGWQDGLRAGRKVTVEGTTDPGGIAPMVISSALEQVGDDPLPPPSRMGLKELRNENADCTWVELEGVVQSVEDAAAHVRFRLRNHEGGFEAMLPRSEAGAGWRPSVNARLRLQGVCTGELDQQGRWSGVVLRVPNTDAIQALVLPPSDPFDTERQPIGRLAAQGQELAGFHRVHVSGQVTLVAPGQEFCLQDRSGALRVRTWHTNAVSLGQHLDVVGFPSFEGVSILLEQALLRPASERWEVTPQEIEAEAVLRSWQYNQMLVRLQGRLLNDAGGSSRGSFLIQSGLEVVQAQFETGNRQVTLPFWQSGDWLELTGVCAIQSGERNEPRSFVMLLRDPSDVVVQRRAPWWTPRHAIMLGGGLLVLVLASLAWVALLRRKVREQTALVRSQLERESALEQSYRDLFENSTDLLFTLNGEGRLTSVNRAMEELFQRPRSELLHRPFWEFLAEESQGEAQRWFEPLRLGQSVPTLEARAITRSLPDVRLEFRARQLQLDGRPAEILGAGRDITARWQAEKALRTSEEKLRSIFLATPTGIGVVSNRVFMEVNARICEMTGYTRQELIGQSSRMLYPTQEEFDFVGAEKYRQISEKGTGTVETRWQRKDGSIIDVLLSSTPIDPDDWPKGVTFTVLDISLRKRAEAESATLQSQLLQAQKMESVGRLAGGVAHDFNNMLQVILGSLELALEQAAPGTSLEGDLQEAQKAARRSADLTRQLLAFARKQTACPRMLNLNDTIEGMLKMLSRLIGEDITLAWQPASTLPAIRIDPAQVDQILANLAVNARDAMSGTGTLTIETCHRVIHGTEPALPMDATPGSYVALTVTDTGRGMPPSVLEHLFEPFFTTKETGKGTGLGLATVFGIVKQNNGFLEVHSQVGHGTTFRLHFPVSEGETTKSQPLAVGRAPHGTETILMVEDERSILDLGRRILQEHGYQVLTAATPEEALSIASHHREPIHLLVSDVVLPGMNGRDLKQQLQTIRPNLRCLFISGYTADIIAHHGVLERETSFLQKPFSTEDLPRKVRTMLDAPRP